MYIFDIRGLLDNTATVYTKIEILPKVAGEEIITLTNENSVKSWVYSDLRNVEKQGFIGQFVARTLDGELQDISDDFNIEDREIVLYLGINSNHTSEIVTENNVVITDQTGQEEFITEQGENELTYYKLGNFFVEKPESDEVRDNTKFKSMDYTILFNSPFNADFKDSEYTKSFNEKIEDDESVTALWLAQYTCKQVGVELATTSFRNSNFAISSNQFDTGYTCRDVIKSIAKLAVTWARIGWNNKLYLDFNKQTDSPEEYNIITNDNYYNLTTQKDVYGEVNRILMGSSVVVGNSAYIENAQSIEDNGLTELDVYDNPILYTQELREQAVANATPMLGLMYQPVEIETTGHPWLLGNELITVVDMEGNYLNTYALDRILTYNGHIRSKINSMAKTEMESTYAYQGVENDYSEIKRSKVELDRQNQTLTSLLERTTANETQISSVRQDLNGVGVNVTNISGNVSNLQNDINIITNNINGIDNSITTINGNVSSLQGDVTNINGDITGINTSINSITGNVSTLQGDINTITGNINTINGNITNINGDITNITGDITDINSDIGTINGNISTLSSNLNGLSANFDDFYDNEYVQTIQDIQNQIDGVIEFWTGNVVPTLNNYPASDWTTEADRQNHNGDVYTIVSGSTQGASYRFVKDGNTWKWIEISDSEIGAVRELAQQALDASSTNASDITTINNNITTINNDIDSINGDVSSLQSDITDINDNIDDIESDVSGLENNVSTINTEVEQVKQSIINLNNDVEDLQLIDVSLQTSIDGISASYSTLSNHVDDLDTEVDGLQTGYDTITQGEKSIIGNPVTIFDCGEYLIKNLTIYGNTLQSGVPTSTTPQEVKSVTGEHTLSLRSNNIYHTPNNTQFSNGITLVVDDNIITLNGTSTGSIRFFLDDELLSLSPGTYTFTCLTEGTTDYQYVPWIRFCNYYASDTLVSFQNKTSSELSKTFTINSTKERCQLWIDLNSGYTFEDYKIKIQLETGSTSTNYSNVYIEPINYTYNLSDLCLHGINDFKDYIKYNITDETWYLSRNIREFKVAEHYVAGYAGSSDTSDYIHIGVYEDKSGSYLNPIGDIKSSNYNIYCNKYEYKGVIDHEEDIPEEEGLFIRYTNNHGNSDYYVYLSTLKTSMGKQAGQVISDTDVKNWIQNADIVLYYVQEEESTEPITDNNLVQELDYIRANAKLYKTSMVIEDVPTIGLKGNIGIDYLIDNVFNAIYASRSELKITQNSISTTVSETVNAVVENIDNRVTDVANTLEQNSKDLSNSINTLNDSLGEYAKQSSLVTVTNSVEEIQTALNEQILVTQQIKEDGVEKVTTTTGFTFDKDGLTIAKTGADTKTLVDEDGMTVYSTTGSEESVLLNVDSQGVQTENLHVRTYTQIGNHSRLQDYEDGTAIFYIE